MRRLLAAAATLVVLVVLAGCATDRPSTAGGPIAVVAAESTWGSLATQLGGDRVKVHDVIDNPAADPHDYEPTVPDGRAVALADLVVVNGAGYDEWANRLVAANEDPRQTVIDVADLVGAVPGDNPHLWYSPDVVRRAVDAITSAYTKIDPDSAGYFNARRDELLNVTLKPYFDAIAGIRRQYAGTPVGASESIFAPMATALGLDLRTPASFLAAVSEGNDPTVADKATVDHQIRTGQIKVYVFNQQNATPDVTAQVVAARAAGIPVVPFTETPTPAGVSFQDWQVAQLTALGDALRKATGR